MCGRRQNAQVAATSTSLGKGGLISKWSVSPCSGPSVRIAAERLADEIAGDIQIIRAHALEAAAKDDLGNRAFWWQLYIGVVMAYARGLFTRQQTIIDQRVQQIVIPDVDQFYRDIRELRRQTPASCPKDFLRQPEREEGAVLVAAAVERLRVSEEARQDRMHQ
jgi:hypothetical protein